MSTSTPAIKASDGGHPQAGPASASPRPPPPLSIPTASGQGVTIANSADGPGDGPSQSYSSPSARPRSTTSSDGQGTSQSSAKAKRLPPELPQPFPVAICSSGEILYEGEARHCTEILLGHMGRLCCMGICQSHIPHFIPQNWLSGTTYAYSQRVASYDQQF